VNDRVAIVKKTKMKNLAVNLTKTMKKIEINKAIGTVMKNIPTFYDMTLSLFDNLAIPNASTI
jgi:hypothetical protein